MVFFRLRLSAIVIAILSIDEWNVQNASYVYIRIAHRNCDDTLQL